MSVAEDTCERCERDNIWSWSVASDRFNAAVVELGLTSAAIICPVCFVDGHERASGMRTTWELTAAAPFHHIGSIDDERAAR